MLYLIQISSWIPQKWKSQIISFFGYILSFKDPKSKLNKCDTLCKRAFLEIQFDTVLDKYLHVKIEFYLAKKAASGSLSVSMRVCRHLSRSPRSRNDRKATLFLPVASAESPNLRTMSTLPTHNNTAIWLSTHIIKKCRFYKRSWYFYFKYTVMLILEVKGTSTFPNIVA